MAAGDIYHISGGLKGRHAVALLGGAVDDGIQIDTFAAGRVVTADPLGTFTAWINPADVTGNYAILGCGDANLVECFYFAVVAGEIQIYSIVGVDVAFDMITIGAAIPAHTWTHVAVVQDGVKPKIYVNGVEFSAAKGTLTETDVTEANFWFGDWPNIDGGHIGCADSVAGGALLTLEFAGGISNVKYWEDPLEESQIVDDFNNINYAPVTLIANWDMHDGYVNAANAGTYDGTAVGDIILVNTYSEFTSRLRNDAAAAPVVADEISITSDQGTGHAIIIKAA